MFTHRENMNADSSPLKRSFGEIVGLEHPYEPCLYPNHTEEYGQLYTPVRPSGLERSQSASVPHKRRSISISSRSISMPLPAGSTSVTSAIFPSFMSIFGGGSTSNLGSDAGQENLSQEQQKDQINTQDIPPRILHPQHPLPTPRDHARSNSVSSLASTAESTESSPTTTSSTFDSPLIADPSPGSSPETPSSALPGLSFRSMTKTLETSHRIEQDERTPTSDTTPISAQSEPLPENSRNVKNLSLKPIQTVLPRPSTSSGIEGMKSLSTESSPLRESALKTGRRKPPGLSIQTPGFAQLTSTQTFANVLPTPNTRPLLGHAQSSPQFPVSIGSAGGLRLPLPLNLRGGHSRPGSGASSNTSFSSGLHEVREEDQSLRSQEVVERGYPNGPVKIYDSGVFLYLEPTAEEASKFDTVINVAKEVKNPFTHSSGSGSETVVAAMRKEEDRSHIPEPQTAVSEISFKSAFEWPTSAASTTPTTPKASSMQQNSRPNYIHVPWDHNSEIIDDLFPLCRTIDEQVSAGNKVLVHCQLGVSRSASLIIAYGLYKGYQTNFHTMYEKVKERSQWVGPNMTLIYQLNDFRSKVEKGEYEQSRKTTGQETQPPTNESTLTPLFNALSTSAMDKFSQPSPAVPVVARVPNFSRPNLNKQLPPVPSIEPETAAAKPQVDGYKPVAVPEAPVLMQLNDAPKVPLKPTFTARPLPLREFAGLKEIPPHRPQQAGMTIIRRIFSPSHMDLATSDTPESPSLFSPRATEFMASPFGRTQAGEIMMGSVPVNTRPSVIRQPTRDTIAPEIDPRAPHQTQEGGEIVRNIDEFLK